MLKYLNFQIKKLLGKLDEYVLHYDEDFVDILNKIDSPIATDLLSLYNKDNKDIDANFINIDINDKSKLTFVQDTKIMKKLKDMNIDDNDEDVEDYRIDYHTSIRPTPIKAGRLVQKILTLMGKTYRASDIEDFVNKFISVQNSGGSEYRFEIYKGDDILLGYDGFSYVNSSGSELDNSCMKSKPDDWFEIYTQNPAVCSLLVCYNKENKIVGRAFLWDANKKGKSFKFMDKIYSSKPAIKELFINYAEKNKLPYRYIQNNGDDKNRCMFRFKGREMFYDNLSVDFEYTNFDYYPYIDTFTFLETESDTGYNCSWGLENYIDCSDTDGEGASMENIQYFERYIDTNGIVKIGRCIQYNEEDEYQIFFGEEQIIAVIDDEDNILSFYWDDDEKNIEYEDNIYKVGSHYNGEERFESTIINYKYNGDKEILTESDIPDTVKQISIYSKTVKKITYLPPHVTYLMLDNSLIEELPEVVPASLITLYNRHGKLSKIPDNTKLKTLNLYNNKNFSDISNLPDTLEELTLSETDISSVENLPDSISILYITQMEKLIEIKRLPKKLSRLEIRDCKNLVKIEKLPKKLTYLDICNTKKLKKLPKLPDTLNQLDAYSSGLEELPNIPESMNYMDLRNTKVTGYKDMFYDTELRRLRKKLEKN